MIVSIIKDSFVEYPDYNSLVIFYKNCNLRCNYCYFDFNAKSIYKSSVEAIKDNLSPINEAVVFLGGEPTTETDDLIKGLSYVKSIGLKTKVFTNGTYPNRVSAIIPYTDAFSVDFKTYYNTYKILNNSNIKYAELVTKSIQKILRFNKELEVRTTVTEDVSEYDLKIIQAYAKFHNIKHIIQEDFRPYLK